MPCQAATHENCSLFAVEIGCRTGLLRLCTKAFYTVKSVGIGPKARIQVNEAKYHPIPFDLASFRADCHVEWPSSFHGFVQTILRAWFVASEADQPEGNNWCYCKTTSWNNLNAFIGCELDVWPAAMGPIERVPARAKGAILTQCGAMMSTTPARSARDPCRHTSSAFGTPLNINLRHSRINPLRFVV